MKVLHVSPMYRPAVGGAQLHLTELSEGLAARGHEVTVLTANVDSHENLWPGRPGGLPARETINGVKVVRFAPGGGPLGLAFNAWQRLPGGYRTLRFLFGRDGTDFLLRKPSLAQLLTHLVFTRADVVASVNWYWPPAYYAYLARRLRRFTLVGIPLFHTAEPWCNPAVYKTMLAACDAVVVNTSHEGDFVRECAGVRVDVAGVGIHPKRFERRNGAEMRNRYGLGTLPVVGFVGRQASNKGLTRLLEAMKTVWKWNQEVRLVVAGPRPTPRGEVESALAALAPFEKERVVRVDDFTEQDKPSIFDAFDVFALPSVSESFGIAYLEAWLCKKPVIGARIGSTQCVIDDGVDGLLVDPDDSQDIAKSIIELLSDASKRRRMGESGYNKTVSRFTWEKVTDKVEGLYLDLTIADREHPRVLAKAER